MPSKHPHYFATAFVALTAIVLGCGAGPDDAKNNRDFQAAAALGTPASPSAELLNDLAKGQPAVDLTDSKKNEENARKLPQVMANSNEAIAKIRDGADALDTVKELQKKNGG